jgi:hypothetical protein
VPDLDDPTDVVRAAEQVAEFSLVSIERDKLVTAKGLDLLRAGRIGAVALHYRNLRVASGMQISQHALEPRIGKNTHGIGGHMRDNLAPARAFGVKSRIMRRRER